MPLNVTNLVFFLFSKFFLLSFTIFTICLFVNLSVFILLEVHWISWVVYVILHLLFVLRIISSFNGCFLIILTGFTREWVNSTHRHSRGWPPLPSSWIVLQTRTIIPCLALLILFFLYNWQTAAISKVIMNLLKDQKNKRPLHRSSWRCYIALVEIPKQSPKAKSSKWHSVVQCVCVCVCVCVGLGLEDKDFTYSLSLFNLLITKYHILGSL